MKMLTTCEFLRHFPSHSKSPCAVKKRGKVVGTWTPSNGQTLPPFDGEAHMARLKREFKKPLSFTGAELLKPRKKP